MWRGCCGVGVCLLTVFVSFDDFFCLCATNRFVFVLVAKKIAKSLYCCAGVVNIFLCGIW